jgi:hypothetical protein
MDSGNLLQGIGLFVCVGAIVLVALVAFAMRSLAGRRGQTNSTQWNTPGTEQPRYDDPSVQSTGGFGSVPATGGRADVFPADRVDNDKIDLSIDDRANRFEEELSDRPLNSDTDDDFRRRTGGTGSQSGFGGSQPRRRDNDDDDNVRSSGGFGGK